MSSVVRGPVICALFACASCGRPGGPPVARDPGQDVLLVTVDTLRADALGVDGGRAPTPALDALAAGGIRFSFAHAHAVTTLPSHASILTGLYPFEHGVRANSGFRLPPAIETLATRLRARGYATGAFVGAFPLDSRFGLDRGFDRYDDQLGPPAAPGIFTERPAEAVVSAARAWIDGQARPWFAWVHLFDPHAPYRPPASYVSPIAADGYASEVSYVDHALAPLLASLRSRAARTALVVVTGDHGEALGDHGELTHGLFAYEATLRVPLVLAQLGGGAGASGARQAPAAVSAAPARHVDIVPTVLDALSMEAPDGLPGRSLLSEAPASGPSVSYFEAMEANLTRGWAPLAGVLVDREKYVELPLPELYDLSGDPAETRDLAGARPARRSALAQLLAGFEPTGPAPPRQESSDAAARLRALGYASGRAHGKQVYTEADDPKRLVHLDRAIAAATERFESGDLRGAIDGYRAVLGQRPDMTDAARQLAFLYWQAGDSEAAIRALDRARIGRTADPGLTAQLGSYMAEAGRTAAALALLEPAARDAAPDLDVLNALGLAYARARRAADAIAVFERVLSADPDNTLALENLASLHLERRDLAAARRALDRALEVNPRAAGALAGLGALAMRAGDRNGAIDAWRRALAVEPSHSEVLYNLATTLIAAGRPDEARPLVERFVRSAPAAQYGPDIARLSGWLRQTSPRN